MLGEVGYRDTPYQRSVFILPDELERLVEREGVPGLPRAENAITRQIENNLA